VNWRACLSKAPRGGGRGAHRAVRGRRRVRHHARPDPAARAHRAEAIATSLVVVTITSLAGLAAHAAAAATVDYGVIAVFAGAALLASLTAGRLANRLPAAALRREFAGRDPGRRGRGGHRMYERCRSAGSLRRWPSQLSRTEA